ncbi:hypothetical protein AVEN_17723-1 [Araneus ventricosus]|uniref:Uncharacterized protein n=1 Tax=Araneus ventricosus TaxID=182803 RepID=A0A4Y2FC86_ARAVE|nr:hypothetical protein AVEN_17723-1 [Araneus ventricosus]
MVKETATQRKRRLEKAKQKRQEKLQQESEAGKSARLAKRRKRAEEVAEKQRNVERANTKERMVHVKLIETVDAYSFRLANDAQRHA